MALSPSRVRSSSRYTLTFFLVINGSWLIPINLPNIDVATSWWGSIPTLIHEIGHLFGCIDLYQTAGGKLQWANTLYGVERHQGKPHNPYTLIEEDKIEELTLRHFQVCRGHLGWTDNNEDGIVDVTEWWSRLSNFAS